MNHNIPLETRKTNFLVKSKTLFGNRFEYNLVDYYNTTTPIIIRCKKHGLFNTTPITHHISKHGGCHGCMVEKSKEVSITKVQDRLDNKFGKGCITWIQSEDYNPHIDNDFICHKHGSFTKTLVNTMYSKFGCPECAIDKIKSPRHDRKITRNNGAINWSKLERDKSLASKNSWVYIIRLTTEDDRFYKVGVSNEDSLYFRLRRLAKAGNLELIHLLKGTMYSCYEMEQLILDSTERYLPKLSFEGKTECFLSEVLDTFEPIVISFQTVDKHVGGKLARHYTGVVTNDLSNIR